MATALSPTYPGVYLTETAPVSHQVTPVTTHDTAFLGIFPQGPVNKAVYVKSWDDFIAQFGALTLSSSYAAYAVSQFFLGGGTGAWIVRLTAATAATAQLSSGITMTAREPGQTANSWSATLTAVQGTPATLTFTLYPDTTAQGTPLETLKGLDPSSPSALADAISEQSDYVTASAAPGATGTVGPTSNPVVLGGGGGDTAAQAPVGPLTITSDFPGSFANGVTAKLQPSGGNANPSATYVDLLLTQPPQEGQQQPQSLETLPGLLATDPDALADTISHKSNYVTASGVSTTVAAGSATLQNGSATQPASGALGPLTVAALTPGTDANSWKATVAKNATDGTLLDYTLASGSTQLEKFQGLPSDPLGLMGAIANRSTMVTAYMEGNLGGGAPGAWTDKLFKTAVLNELGAGQTVPPPLPRLDQIAPQFFNLMCIPDATLLDAAMQAEIFQAAHQFCFDRRAFLIVDPPPPSDFGGVPSGWTTAAPPPTVDTVAQDSGQSALFGWADDAGLLLESNVAAATYYPWVQIPDPANPGQQRLVPPSGTVAGVYAASDQARGVWKAPAGVLSSLTNAQTLADLTIDDTANGNLNPHGINCLRTFPVWQNVSWGARTLAGDDLMQSPFKYVSTRRLANYIELSLEQSLKWAVFEPNEESLWAAIVAEVTPFMNRLYASGAFDGPDAKSAYVVACDATTTTEQDRLNGIVNVNVGFNPVEPAEFVVLNVQVGGLAPATAS
ncbi:MAG: phage tail sheath family protein [Gaiellaceae bacterium]